ncbi:Beta-glucosidase 12 [Stylosanthes scabra]|uniref:Beta-glucosidase 12 n=1 Tax=Stylosanthes scabra TaxID=79078 RepID=A0ABU6THG6_9FABA|nr:Beta-glucosidase 12 [Stylosanthes scabra]
MNTSLQAAIIFNNGTSLNRTSFPDGFVFGTSSSAYQYEGAADVGGRTPSIWDTFSHNYPEKIADRSNADIAIDEYHRYKEDVEIMKDLNMDAYRFSISWSRILPKGKLSGSVNKEGIKYYNNLINQLLAKDIQPYVTIFHWDIPQDLEDEYGGLLSPKIVDDFRDYAEVCFKEFGDRVKHWITLNEPWSVAKHGYADGIYAPGRCSAWQNLNCTGGDSATEPYIVSHYQLLAHAAAVNIYKTKYQASQKGKIGIAINAHWMWPLYDTKLDHLAAQRALDFMLGWFMDPLTSGDYPVIMRSLVGSRLPNFSSHESRLIRGSFDFIGLNYYTSEYATDAPQLSDARPSFLTDALVILSSERNGMQLGARAVYPEGLGELLLYIKEKYNNPLIYITENGIEEPNDPTLSLEEALNDTIRIDYFYSHLYYIQTAIKDGANIKGYFAWSLMDNFEWNYGYSQRYGIVFVDYKNNGLKKYPKLSATWFKNFLQCRVQGYTDSR